MVPSPGPHDVAAPGDDGRVPGRATSCFWGDRLASGFAYLSGPVYFIPLFVPLCIFIATVLLRLWRRHRWLADRARAAVLVVATVPFLYDKSKMNHNISAAQVPWKEAAATVARRARW